MAVTLLEHGEWLASKGELEQAEPLLAEARGMFDGLGAAPWRERVVALVEPLLSEADATR